MSNIYASEKKSADLHLFQKAAMYLRTAAINSDQMTKQAESISAYAKNHGIEIVVTYEDYGKDGLTTEGREGLQRLMQDINSGNSPFSILLMQNFSRWGRFQDTNEGINYEHTCQKAGIKITYVDEQKEESNTSPLAIINGLRRVMLGKYSR